MHHLSKNISQQHGNSSRVCGPSSLFTCQSKRLWLLEAAACGSPRSRPNFRTPLIYCEGRRAPLGGERCSELKWKQAPLSCRSLWSPSVRHIEQATLVLRGLQKNKFACCFSTTITFYSLKFHFLLCLPASDLLLMMRRTRRVGGKQQTWHQMCVAVWSPVRLGWGHWVRSHARWWSAATLTNGGLPLLIPGCADSALNPDGRFSFLCDSIICILATLSLSLRKPHHGKMGVDCPGPEAACVFSSSPHILLEDPQMVSPSLNSAAALWLIAQLHVHQNAEMLRPLSWWTHRLWLEGSWGRFPLSPDHTWGAPRFLLSLSPAPHLSPA